ncbi:MAG: PorP/SprF family type IX secretion system membrane protein [Flavobacteriales bacterium]|nr:PorP/SprF family type IX secretion system membrane protein [Flavobacteriales bacterium]
MNRIIILLLTCLSLTQLRGQDIHFSQFFNTPLIINPALTGVFGGDQRAMILYRNQWSSIATPYKTYGASFDMRMLDKRNSNFSLGTGLGVYKDIAGDSEYGITNVVLSLSGIIQLDKKQHLTIGIQGGFEQRSINNTALIWDSQYDGSSYNPSLSSHETTNYNQGISNGDLNVGLAWVYSKSQKSIVANDVFSLKLGGVYQHLTQQSLDYGGGLDKLYGKMSFHGESNISIKSTNTSFKPSFIYQKQGPSQEVLVGTLIRYAFGHDSKYTGLMNQTALFVGIHTRLGDAFIPSIGYEIANWKLTFSYDANVSKLASTSNGVGGFEISLIFINPNPFTYGKGNSARFN